MCKDIFCYKDGYNIWKRGWCSLRMIWLFLQELDGWYVGNFGDLGILLEDTKLKIIQIKITLILYLEA